jgi:hypothetical protein
MLKTEAQWVGDVLDQLATENISPILNVGSASAAFREEVQPWIDREIFAPLRRRGVSVRHLDIQKGDGIDLSGDLTDDAFIAGLGSYGYKALLCCNLLEHVPVPSAICTSLELLLPVGGYLLITVPNRFPYHPDPIDTMFRPGVEGITRLFPHCRLLRGEVLDCGTGWDYVDRNPAALIAKVKRRLSGLNEHGGVKGSASFLPWLFRQFRQSCALLQRNI